MGEVPFKNPDKSPVEAAQALFEQFLSNKKNLAIMESGAGIGGQALEAAVHRCLKDIENDPDYGKSFALVTAPFLQADLRSENFLKNHDFGDPSINELMQKYDVILFTRAARNFLSEYLDEEKDDY